MAGILQEMPALAAIAAPTALSYARLVPDRWAGESQCWGVENKSAAMRLVCHHDHRTRGANSTSASREDADSSAGQLAPEASIACPSANGV
jgi:glutamine synthetase